MHAVSISMPSSPLGAYAANAKRVISANHDERAGGDHRGNPDPTTTPRVHPKDQTKFHSQPMPGSGSGDNLQRHTRVQDKRFDSFKTWSGKLERQLSNLRGKPHPVSPEDSSSNAHNPEINLPVDRFFDALEGPELDTLRVCAVSFSLYAGYRP